MVEITYEVKRGWPLSAKYKFIVNFEVCLTTGSSKANSPGSAIWYVLFQPPLFSGLLKVIQLLLTSFSSLSHFLLSLYISCNNVSSRQFLRKLRSMQLVFLLLTDCRMFLSSLIMYTNAQFSLCTNAQFFLCTNAQFSLYTNAQFSLYINAQISLYTNAQFSLCTSWRHIGE
jgi:hypothetical protein